MWQILQYFQKFFSRKNQYKHKGKCQKKGKYLEKNDKIFVRSGWYCGLKI